MFIPCDEGLPLPDLNGVLFDQFNRLTSRPSIWHSVFVMAAFLLALTVVPRK